MAIPAILRGLSSLIPGLGGAAYVGSQKPEGIEEVFKVATGTAGISRASEDLTKEINIKKVADRLKAAGVDPETANKIAQGAVGQIGEAVIGDDEASTIAQDIGKGLEGGKPSGSAMIDVEGIMSLKDEESGKIIPFQKPEKDDEEDPNKAPDPDSLPDIVNLKEEKEKQPRSAFADTYSGKVMESVMKYLNKAGYDSRESALGVMMTPLEELEDILKNAEDYVMKPNKIANLEEIQKIYDRETNRPYEGEGSFENYLKRVDKVLNKMDTQVKKIEDKYGEKITNKESFEKFKDDVERFKAVRKDEPAFRSMKKDFHYYLGMINDDLEKLGEDKLILSVSDYFEDFY